MNKIVNKSLPGDKFVPERHCSPFAKNKELIKNFLQTGDFIHKNDVNKASFQHDLASGKSKDLAVRTESDKFLRDKVF